MKIRVLKISEGDNAPDYCAEAIRPDGSLETCQFGDTPEEAEKKLLVSLAKKEEILKEYEI